MLTLTPSFFPHSKKKKKKKSSTTERVREVDSASVAERSASPGGGASGSGSGAKDEAGSGYDVYKTEAQRRFEEVQKKRVSSYPGRG